MLEISEIPVSLAQGRGFHSSLAAGLSEAVRLFGCLPHEMAGIELRKKSIDARKRSRVHMVMTIRITFARGIDEEALLARVPEEDRRRVRRVDGEDPSFPQPLPRPAGPRPVVVGAGCAGLFCALYLAEAGLEPLLLDRGDDAARRTEAIEGFHRTRVLDPESNIQFGMGGAGTFSDGKLSTGTKNPLHRLILRTLVEAGAPREILWDGKPHIGSDILPGVVDRIAHRIGELGGEVRMRTRLTDIERTGAGAVRAVRVASAGGAGTVREERIPCDRLVLACGHSARDVFEMLDRRGFALERKTFAMGVRIEHPQSLIDRAQYGPSAGDPALGAAPYKLVVRPRGHRSVFSFCMCPGGEVVAAASEPGGVVTNGASESARDGANANAALLVNVVPEDLAGPSPLAGVELQRACERAAFERGGGGYRAPAQLLGDFLSRVPSTGPGRVAPTYPMGVAWGEIDGLLPDYVIGALRAGIPLMDRRIKGYLLPDAVLTGVESRSSSPVRVVRDGSCEAVGAPGLFPCGEGAGYAGGIMSAATDGIRCARALMASLERP